MVYRVDKLTDSNINPITKREYDNLWLAFSINCNVDTAVVVGSNNGGVYTIRVSKLAHDDWRLAVGDFIGYCNANSINGIIEMSQSDYGDAINHYNGHSFNEQILRDYEPTVLIHSTTMESWFNIQREGMLKSWNRLKGDKIISEDYPIGVQLGDPISFSDYIMFGGGITGEIVVNSKQSGKIVMDVNAEYQTGARLYFDARRMAKDGLLVRDGCHIKVKDTLLLEPYLIWFATWDKIGLSSPISTPKIFSETSDEKFGCIYSDYL